MDEEKRPVGRPSKYKPEFCQEMIDFFSKEPTEMRLETELAEHVKIGEKCTDAEKVKTTKKGGGVDFPTFTEFSEKIGVCDDTLVEWAKVHEDFSAATKRCKKLQEKIWIINGLHGNYNPQFSVFLGKNVF